MHPPDGMVLAGGSGTRLRSVLSGKQKVIAPVDGEPFLFRILDSFNAAGVKKIVLALGYRADEVLASIDSRVPEGMTIIPSVENKPLGTGGAIRHASRLISSDDILVANGDSLIKYPLINLIDFHRQRQAKATLLLCEVLDMSRYGTVTIDPTGTILSFQEKKLGLHCPGIINAGVYMITRKLAEEFPEEPHSLETTTLPKLCGDGLYGLATRAPFIDIGTPSDYRKATEFLAQINRDIS